MKKPNYCPNCGHSLSTDFRAMKKYYSGQYGSTVGFCVKCKNCGEAFDIKKTQFGE